MLGWSYKSQDEREFIDEIKNLSDRLVGILAPIIVDTRITEALKSRLNDGPMKGGSTILADLFAPHGELGSFGTRLRLAYAMEILKTDTFSDLLNIEKIRNAFAHNLHIKNFTDQPVIDLVRNIKINELYPTPGRHKMVKPSLKGFSHVIGPSPYDDKKPREKFLRAIQIISHEMYVYLSLNPTARKPI